MVFEGELSVNQKVDGQNGETEPLVVLEALS